MGPEDHLELVAGHVVGGGVHLGDDHALLALELLAQLRGRTKTGIRNGVVLPQGCSGASCQVGQEMQYISRCSRGAGLQAGDAPGRRWARGSCSGRTRARRTLLTQTHKAPLSPCMPRLPRRVLTPPRAHAFACSRPGLAARACCAYSGRRARAPAPMSTSLPPNTIESKVLAVTTVTGPELSFGSASLLMWRSTLPACV